MEMTRDDLTVAQVLELRKNGMLTVNAEYQRGEVWSRTQKKKLIDSVMRGYPLPLIYLRYIKKKVAGMQREDLEIIDGQQRINALYEFSEGAYKLLDPIRDDSEARFPKFLKDQPCPWAGMDFRTLSSDLQSRLLDTQLAVAKITTDEDNETRDLFVRLQSGLPLTSQETRDAWPGDFTDFVLRLGGKPQLARYPGHDFFQRVMRMKPATDRGTTRTTAAQIAMLFLSRREHGSDHFTDINAKEIDNFYYSHIDFDAASADAKRLVTILDKATALLGTGKRPKLKAHEAIHLVLLLGTLWDEYTRSWEATLPGAVDKFSAALSKGAQTRYDPQPDPFWLQYGQWTRVNSDRADNIRRRHQFYAARMLKFLQPLQLKDPKRLFGPLEREIIYFRDAKKCAVCKSEVAWEEVEIHHGEEHTLGGPTRLENGHLVHRYCHPKGRAAQEFALKGVILETGEYRQDTPLPPQGGKG